ncbi:MAG: type III secretion system translocon subunit SctE [Puniceicoccales bacterium]|jgi:hypothetical protein|nr:type III secretion system translocon subunit SctE [Puniceicoccales bacterium]
MTEIPSGLPPATTGTPPGTPEGTPETSNSLFTSFFSAFGGNTIESQPPNVLDILNEVLAAQNKPALTNPQQNLENVLAAYPQTSQEILDNIQRLKDSGIFDGSHLDISKLDSDGMTLLCMLFTQQSKSELIKSLKSALENKTAERNKLQNDYLADQQKVLDDLIAMEKAIEEQKKKALWKAIFGVVAAVISVVVAVAVTVATCGAAAPVAALAIAACVCSVTGAVCGLAAASCTLAACTTDDPEVQKKLGQAALGLGIASAVFGIAGAICGGVNSFKSVADAAKGAADTANAAKTATDAANNLKHIAELVKQGGRIAGGLVTISQGVFGVIGGVDALKLAETIKSMNEKEIQMTKLGAEIEFLTKLIDLLTESTQEFLELFLTAEEAAAAELARQADAESELANQVPHSA